MLMTPVLAMSQSAYESPRNYNAAVLEALRPSFAGIGSSFTTAAYSASYQFGVGNTGRTFITASLPFAHTSLDDGPSETALGNPYIGVTLFSKRDPVVYEFGVRLPLASDNAGLTAGFFGDFDQFEAYQPDLLSFQPSLVYFPARSGDWVMFTRLAPVLMIRTGETDSEARGELYANYALHFFYYGQAVQGGISFTGRAALTEDGNFNERTVHHMGFTIQKDLGPVIPGIHFRYPLDTDIRDAIDFTLGVLLIVPV